jgi:hypothetical protein
VAGGRVQAVGVTLLSHSRLLLRPKLARSRGQRPEVNLASGNERKDKLLDSSCYVAR